MLNKLKIKIMKKITLDKVLIILLSIVIVALCCTGCSSNRVLKRSFTACQVYRHSQPIKPNNKATEFQGNIKVKKSKYNKHLSGNFCQVKTKKVRKAAF